jgi:hypothetical protein
MTRLMTQLDDIARELAQDIENLKRLAEAIPQLLERKHRQLERVADVTKSMASEDEEILALITRYTETRRPARRGGGRRRGRTLPSEILTLIHAAGPQGASLDHLFDKLSQTRELTRQNLSSTLSRMKSQGKIARDGANFVALEDEEEDE